MPLEVVEDLDHETVERFVRKNGTVFSTPSWSNHTGVGFRSVGVFKGQELLGAGVVPVLGGDIPAVVPATPWTGLATDARTEGVLCEVARSLARHLLSRYGDVSLTLDPSWKDLRGFMWEGMRTHARYTYRGRCAFPEKRMRPKDAEIAKEMTATGPGWRLIRYSVGDTVVEILRDWTTWHYLSANQGGSYHTECIVEAMSDCQSARDAFDMVGCNSPSRSLFKRQFGYPVVPYFAVTTLDPADVPEWWGVNPKDRGKDAGPEDLREMPDRADFARAAGL